MKNVKIESATVLCKSCEMIYGFDVQTTTADMSRWCG